jgi:hypothetical protein
MPAAKTARIRIGLWDVNHAIPALEAIARQFNRRQDMYEFEVVDISAPIGTWRPSRDKKDKSPGMINGGEVAEKLGGQVTALGLRRVVAVTTFALRGTFHEGDVRDLALWNDDPSERVTILSAANGMLEALYENKEEFPAGRFIANCLANALSGVAEHEGPPRDCPNFYEARQATMKKRLEYTAGHQKFCGFCTRRAKARFKSLKILEALQGILDAY